METEKLYYSDPFCREFTARVLTCAEEKGHFLVTLDRTAFYPEGGGQAADRGDLGGAAVLDVHEREGQVVHFCDRPLAVGETVTGTLDWDNRFDNMQAHSGEHILSGVVHEWFGYDNVGFHMGADCMTIDFNGPLTAGDLDRVERRVNEVIWQDVPVETSWPDGETLAQMSYRSKKELTGAVRIVTVDGADACACCGTHVLRTGQIGLIKILSCQTFRSGVRLELLCGRRALERLNTAWEQNRRVAQTLSAKSEGTFAAVSRVKEELDGVKFRLTELENTLFAQTAEGCRGVGDVLLFEDGLEPDGVRRLAAAILEACGGRAAVFSGEGESYKYALGAKKGDLRPFGKAMNEALSGRGGGKPGFLQGSVQADRAAIEAFFAKTGEGSL